ncbi:MAG: hypothetical protein GC193_00865, partial [Cryomorphaceae bacterium]|nr:hypothetical protein [Cryomorphaceae bacterium]
MKKAMQQPLLWLILLLSISVTSSAQLVVNTSASGTDLANALIGSGVTISNVNLDCGPNASGLFTGGNTTNVGIDQGVLLTTGLATDAIGPNSAGNTSFDHSSTYHGDADLQAISAFPLNDACSLSFDFTSQSSLITVQYSFASEEYNEYVCSVYNDLFAFFVTGPNPMGGQYSNQNVALIPGTNLPVAINAVNNGSPGSQSSGNCTSLDYSSFYVNNVGGTSIEYDGFTVVFTAEIPITPGEDYSFKFVIADVSDGVLDSGVFIKGESFSVFACQAGNISFENGVSPLVLCADDNQISEVNVITNSLIEGDTYTFLLTSTSGEILDINASGDFLPETYGLTSYKVYGLSYSGVFSLPEVGDNIADITVDADFGCFELSQPLTINVENCIPECTLEVICPNNQGGSFQCVSDIPLGSISDVIIVDSCNQPEIFIDYEDEGNGCINDVYTRQIIYTIIDGDVTASCTVNYTAVDDVAPVSLTDVPAEITVECSDDVPSYDVIFTDNCDDLLEPSAISSIGIDGCTQIISRSWSATDDCGNVGTVSQVVYIVDTQAPVAVTDVPAVITVECSDDVPSYDVIFTDNCDDLLELSAISSIGIDG